MLYRSAPSELRAHGNAGFLVIALDQHASMVRMLSLFGVELGDSSEDELL